MNTPKSLLAPIVSCKLPASSTADQCSSICDLLSHPTHSTYNFWRQKLRNARDEEAFSYPKVSHMQRHHRCREPSPCKMHLSNNNSNNYINHNMNKHNSTFVVGSGPSNRSLSLPLFGTVYLIASINKLAGPCGQPIC